MQNETIVRDYWKNNCSRWTLHVLARPGSKMGKTLPATRICESHIVVEKQNSPLLIYVHRHLNHEVTSPQAFEGLRMNHRKVRRPDLTIATMDKNFPTS